MTSTKVGYSGGDFDDPTYADIITGKTGHAEAVRVEYDQDEISLEEILHYFFKIHDPTTKNRPGLTHQCLYFEQPHTFEQILFIQTAEPALVGHA